MNAPVDHSLTKYRPTLTLAQMQTIVKLCDLCPMEITGKSLTPLVDFDTLKSIKKILIPMIAKVEVGAINPSYTISQVAQEKREQASERTRYEMGNMSAEESAAYEAKILGL